MQPTTQILPPPRPRARKRRSARRLAISPWLVVGGTATLGTSVLIAGFLLLLLLSVSTGRVAAGVTVAGIPVGDASADEARTLLESLSSNPVQVTDAERQWQVALSDLGVQVDVDALLEAAFAAPANTPIPPQYTIDLARAQSALIDLSAQVNVPPSLDNPDQEGRLMEIPVTLDRLRLDPVGELSDGILDLDMMLVDPPIEEVTVNYTGVETTHTVEAGQELGLIAREYNVSVEDVVNLNALTDPDLLFIGQTLRIPAPGIFEPTAADAPPAPSASGRSILVSTGEQRIYAYENGQLVRSHLVSTGRSETPTVLGDYHVYVKYVADDMSGPDYFLPQVPYTMYFYQGYAIHGTYWHNSFGRPMSHGCVNLPTPEAEWFFNFAEVGTLVRVI